jgi:hypothetical protein
MNRFLGLVLLLGLVAGAGAVERKVRLPVLDGDASDRQWSGFYLDRRDALAKDPGMKEVYDEVEARALEKRRERYGIAAKRPSDIFDEVAENDEKISHR